MDTNDTNGWVKLFHPYGPQVTLPVPMLARLSVEQAVGMLAAVSAYLDAGFLVNPPGLEDGELAEEVSAVARRDARDETTIIDFYSANTKLLKKFLHVYLNNEQDVAAFEAATGLKVDAITGYDGALAIARDDSKAGRYVINLPRPIKIIWKLSPKWEEWKAAGGEGNEPHKRLLVRYDPGTDLPTLTEGAPLIRKYADGSDANPAAFTIYDAYLHQRKAAPMSAEGLKAWYANPANKVLVKLPTAV